MMHPELKLLEQRYIEVITAAQQGHISEADAMATLAQLTAIDGEGATWTIDPHHGVFIRTLPGQAPVQANPAAFIPSRLPQPDAGLIDPTSGATWDSGASAKPAKKKGVPGASALSGVMGSLSGAASGRGRLLILVVVVVSVLGGFLYLKSSGGDAASEESSVSATQDPSGQDTEQTQSTGAVEQPQAADVDAVLKAISSSNFKNISPLLSAAQDKPATLLSVAAMSGAAKLGFKLVATDLSVSDAGPVVIVAAMRDDQQVGAFRMLLVRSGKVWALGAPVEPQP